jgi:hypothetical protein
VAVHSTLCSDIGTGIAERSPSYNRIHGPYGTSFPAVPKELMKASAFFFTSCSSRVLYEPYKNGP